MRDMADAMGIEVFCVDALSGFGELGRGRREVELAWGLEGVPMPWKGIGGKGLLGVVVIMNNKEPRRERRAA
jgi:hypothetical protein